MNLGVAKVLAGYLAASVAALVASVQLACALGGQTMISFSGNFFR
jgi:hypothetical protein